jgi:glycosyltransferase involved in cell wall biosynthesis
MRIVQASFIRPHHAEPDRLLEDWPTLLDIAAAVREAGVNVTLLQSFARNIVVERRGVICRFVAEPALPGAWSGMAPWRLARAARQARPDVIHVNGLDFAAHTRAMTATRIPVLVQDHGSRVGHRRMRRRWGLVHIAGAAFTDAEQARTLVDERSLPSHVRLFSVPESSTHFTLGDHERARAATGTSGDPLVLWVGRFDSNKDPLTILNAVEFAAPDLPNVHLWCCFHEEPLLKQVRARIGRSALLRERVHLLGKVPHETIEQLCRAADIFVAASRHEGSGYALIEALACGTPPVVSDIPSFRRLAGRVGVLARVGDPQSFAAALKHISAQPRADLRRKVLDHFAADLSFAAIGRQLREAYETLARVA